jgi:hypothetical protein
MQGTQLMRLLIVLLTFIVIGYGLSWLAKYALRRWLHTMASQFHPTGGDGDIGNTSEDERLVKCDKCSTFIPRSRAITGKNGYYCSSHE